MKCPQPAKIWRKKVDQWFPGAGEIGGIEHDC